MLDWERRAEASTGGKQRKKALEEKMDNVIGKMNMIIVAVVCVVFGCLLGICVDEE
jgi:hypothetical protein